MRSVALRYCRFPIYSWSALVQQLTTQSPVILLGVLFSPAVVGLFALSRRVMLEPIFVIGDALARVYLQKIASDKTQWKGLGGTD